MKADPWLDYSVALLGRVSGTLDKLIKSDKIEAVLSTYNFDELPGLGEADPLAFRNALADLLRTLLIMLSRKEPERAYTVPFELARDGAPQFFFHPRLRLADEDKDEVGFWIDPETDSPQVLVGGTSAEIKLRSQPAQRQLTSQIWNIQSPGQLLRLVMCWVPWSSYGRSHS